MAGCRAEKAGNLNFKDTAVLEVAVLVQEMVVNGCQLLPGVTRCCQAVARCCQIIGPLAPRGGVWGGFSPPF